MPLYEVAILENEDKDNDKPERLVSGPEPILAKDDQAAAFAVVMGLDKGAVDQSRMEVLVRPFG